MALIEHLTLGFDLSCDLGVLGSSPVPGSGFSMESS